MVMVQFLAPLFNYGRKTLAPDANNPHKQGDAHRLNLLLYRPKRHRVYLPGRR